MARKPLTNSEANVLIKSLVNMPVSLPWKGIGSAVFFELGELAEIKRPR